MTLQTLLYTVSTLKKIQVELRTTELLDGLTLVYELPSEKHFEIQHEIYKKFHPMMEKYEAKDEFEVDLLGIKFVFTKKI